MLYAVLKVLTNIFYRIYYKLEIKGLNKVPNKKSIILAPNHTNGFIDPAVIAMTVPQKVRAFARGDVFKKPIARWILNSISISPVYRLQEGYSELKKNDKTFEECRKLLAENKTLLIFPEAICVQEKRLQPLKKGLSRIIFQTEEIFDFKKNVWIVPIGINYSDPKKFGSNLFVNFGDPISIKKYEEFYKQDKVRAINEFTKMLEQEMEKLIIIIKNKNNDELVAGINEIYLHHWMKEKNYDCKNIEKQYRMSKEIVEMVNYHDSANPHLIDSLKKKIIPYRNQLKKFDLVDPLLRPENIHKMNLQKFILDFITIWFGMPIFIIGGVMNYPPYFVAKTFSDKKIKQDEFYASIYLNMSMLIWVLYYGLQLLVVALAFHSWILLLIYAFIVPITGFYVLKFNSLLKRIFGRWRLLRLVRKDKTTIEKLLNERVAIIEELDFAKKKYLAFLKL